MSQINVDYMTNQVTIIAGPTASGKSKLAFGLALKMQAEGKKASIINADSQQVYKELPILSAQPSQAEMKAAPHLLYGCWDWHTICSAGVWAQAAADAIQHAWKKDVHPIVCGGTGFYLMALIEGLKQVPDIDLGVRKAAVSRLEEIGSTAFYQECQAIDAETTKQLEPNDSHRLLRLWEVFHGTGKPLSWWRQDGSDHQFLPQAQWRKILLLPPRAEIYTRIDNRAEEMVEQGAIEEVEALLKLDLPDYHPLKKAVGVQEIEKFLTGLQTKEEMLLKLQQRTRNFAKRQTTWFKHQYEPDMTLEVVAVEKL